MALLTTRKTHSCQLETVQIKVMNILGEVIYSEQIKNVSKKEIDLEDAPSGIYFVQVQAGERIFNKKIVVQ